METTTMLLDVEKSAAEVRYKNNDGFKDISHMQLLV